ncbi:2-dehydro-3-deoxy-D-gluconate 5-dehydrogenase [subsurface metagenome]|jgi:NAD(P)-dependent dehydrogenase (short-subunit alcohol dehydrogenase family)
MMSIPNLSLEGQVAIVTGGGTGIGRSIALEFAKAGADVVVASRRLPVLEEVGREVTVLGKRSLAVQTDISRKTDVDNLVQRVMDKFGVIDILLNNVGVVIRHPLLEASEDDWDQTMNIDLKGYFLCCQAVGKKMVERKKGNIINIASTAGFRVAGNRTAYSIAKAGVVMLTRCLAVELGSYNIRVNAIAPGLVRTEMSEVIWSDPERLKEEVAGIPLGRVAEPSDIASVALFLASDASRHITGDTIVVDGGGLA